MTLLLLLLGFVLLIVGAEMLVRGASRLATAAGISPLVVGLTVVAFGTSSPDLAVSIGAAFAGTTDVAIGNVVGSNIFNVLFVLGLSALVAPLMVSRQLVRLDVPLLIVLSVVVALLALDGSIGRLDGVLLTGVLAVYTVFLIVHSRRETAAATDGTPVPASASRWYVDFAMLVLGLGLLVLGSHWLVQAAVALAVAFGVSELVIGLTVIAAGTSLPEVVTSVVASLRGERDIAVGNVVGSCLFNLMAVLGITALVAPAGLDVAPAVLRFDLPVMIAVAFVCLPIFFTGGRISRAEGALLFGYYIAYTAFVVLAATEHHSADALATALLFFALPLTTVTLLVVTVQALRRR